MSEENTRAVVSISGGRGGTGAASPAGLEGEGGSAGWRSIYDRVEALLPRVEALAGDRARLEEIAELSEAREKSLHARLLQAEASRMRWKTAYIELPLLANPKIAELQENDLKDCKTCEALVDVHNSGPCEDAYNSQLKVLPKEARTGVENEDHQDITGDLRVELRKLKEACETLSSHKDKEICALLGVKDFLWNQLRTIDKENTALLKIKEVEAAQATEATQKLQQNIEEMQVAAQKLQQNIEEMQVAAQHKDNEIGRSRAEAANANKRVLILDGKLMEMHSFFEEKNDEIQKLKNLLKIKEVEAAQATKEAQKLQQNILRKEEELEVAAQNKDDEIGRLRAEVVDAENKLRAMEKDNTALLKIKEVEGVQATEAIQKLQKDVEKLHVAARDKIDKIQKFLEWQLESLKAQEFPLPNASNYSEAQEGFQCDAAFGDLGVEPEQLFS